MPEMKRWKCFGVSEGPNSFGLFGVRFLDEAGRFYEVAASSFNVPEWGDVVLVPEDECEEPHFYKLGYEIPERKLPDAPKDVIAAVWAIPRKR